MNRLSGWVVFAAMLAAGCASAPEHTANADGAAAAQDPAEGAVAAAPREAAEGTERSAEALETIAPVTTFDANSLDPGSVVRCRDMLKPASNVIVRQCMTRDDWERYERLLELQAQRLLRSMQGSGFP